MAEAYRIGAQWVVIDRLVFRTTGWVKGGRRGGPGRTVPSRFWAGGRWADDYLHAMAFDSEPAAWDYIRTTFGKG
jgi:hypothetical protein